MTGVETEGLAAGAAAVGAAAPRARGRYRALAAESLWLFTGYALTAALGLVFWVAAARATSPAELGHDAALISIITAASTIGSAGVGTALVVMLAGHDRATVLRRSYLTAIIASAVLGLGAGVLAWIVVTPASRWWIVVPAVAALTVGWSLYTIQAQALTGLGRAPLTVAVNGPVNLVKLLLIVLVTVAALEVPHVVLLATMLPAIASVAAVGAFVLPRAMRTAPIAAPDPSGSGVTFGQYVSRDTIAIGSTLGVSLCLTFIVTALAGPEQGAVFAVAYQFGSALDLVAVSAATALGRGAVTSAHLRAEGLRVWLRVAAIVAAGAVAIVAVSPIVYSLLGKEYDGTAGMVAVVLLVLGCVLRSSFTMWTALLRARRHVWPVAYWNATSAAVVLGGALVLTPLLGGAGAGLAVVAAAILTGVVGLLGLRREAKEGAVA